MTDSINDAYDDRDHMRQDIRQGICPVCGGALDMPHPSRNIFLQHMLVRQCYDCEDLFYMPERED